MIFYLSGTGNSLWAARQISRVTHDSLITMTETGNADFIKDARKGEPIGFVFPVHGWRPPRIVLEFINAIDSGSMSDRYVYAVVTAGDNIGETIDILSRELEKKGCKLNAATSLIMPESYIGLPFMDTDTLEKENGKIQTSRRSLKEFINRIAKRQDGIYGLVTGKWPRVNTRLLGGVFTKWLITDKPFRIEVEKCLRCGKCAEKCPVDNIRLSNGGYPEWRHNGRCMTCFACYHHCPAKAIRYGNRTKGKGQYYFGKNFMISDFDI